MVHLLFAIHSHQPVGNFDFIFARAYDRAYRPFLNVLKAHPRIGVSLHYSGILLDWLEINRPEYIQEVRELCQTGQIEILGGGYYEPILPMLTDADKEGQIRMMNRKVEKLFGAAPQGMWLAERVWEPSLAAPIARAGIEYVVLDGSHFKMVGKTDADLDGYFQTEDQGHVLKLFPIHDSVRDTIPFREVGEVVGNLRALNVAPRVQIVFGDDGEKFGDWPHTFETVYTQGWLDRFFSAMEAEPETFVVEPLRAGIESGKNRGLIYLPPASYQEMMVWAQNPGDIPRFRNLRSWLQDSGRGEDAERFLRGTFWRNFLGKYSESNRMHKQGLRLSREIEAARSILAPEVLAEARDHLWQSQCNCGYWHGVFGGLYLPHLRFAIYRQLIKAQQKIDSVRLGGTACDWEEADWDFDGNIEFQLNSPDLLVSFTSGGAVNQFWLKRTGFNLCDTLTRRREAYHEFVATGPQGGTKLENQIASKEAGLESFLTYDRRVRENFSEWLLPPGTSFESYVSQSFEPMAVPVFGPAEFLPDGQKAEIRFEGHASFPGLASLRILKRYTLALDGSAVNVEWRFRSEGGEARFRFVVESLFCLLAGNAPDRYVSWKESGEQKRDILASRAEMRGITHLEVTDEWLRIRCTTEAPGSTALWRDAIETVSQSEGGYERVFQGTVAAPVWDLEIPAGGEVTVRFHQTLKEENTHDQPNT